MLLVRQKVRPMLRICTPTGCGAQYPPFVAAIIVKKT
jgi:hypothetical protein